MNILKSLSIHDTHWREVAKRITGNDYDADNLVQEMYMRMFKYVPKDWNYSYVYLVMWNLFKDSKNANKKNCLVFLDTEIYKKIADETRECNSFNDSEKLILTEIKKLPKKDQELLLLNYDLSVGKIAEKKNECRIKTHRKLISIRKTILGEELEGYKNKRLKHFNNGK